MIIGIFSRKRSWISRPSLVRALVVRASVPLFLMEKEIDLLGEAVRSPAKSGR